ncbi:60S ribosomal protein L30-2 [Zea mays]|uniref:60S ribosomal protein L30-2 n=1 Tax=Zea mays TaxID=4577 RepID=A0A1D6M727_MAIZE|nr:60S ribosomal protein L30-2 [Zea mays]AQK86870.1 60S ribosomal protein L30-2 [Zea mays]
MGLKFASLASFYPCFRDEYSTLERCQLFMMKSSFISSFMEDKWRWQQCRFHVFSRVIFFCSWLFWFVPLCLNSERRTLAYATVVLFHSL